MTLRPLFAAAALLALAACAQDAAPVATPAPAPPMATQAQAPAAAPDRPRALPVFFEAWSADIGPQAVAALQEVADRVKAAPPQTRLLVVGYASPRGSGEANALLSQLRARKVYDALVEMGVPAARLRRASRGPTPGMEELESRRVEVRLDEAPAPRRRR